MKTFKCEEMMCGHCVSRIDFALNEAGIEHQIDLESKTVALSEDDKVEEAKEILDDLGFTPAEV